MSRSTRYLPMIATFATVFVAHPERAWAIDAQANDFVAGPPGYNVILLYYTFQTSGYYNNTLSGTEKSHTGLNQSSSIFRYVYYNQVATVPYALEFLVPAASVSGAEIGGNHLDDEFGATDPILGEVVWPVSNPAQKQYLAVALYEYLPLGEYDATRPISLGSNRWQGDLQIAYTQGWGHKVSTDLVFDYVLYSDNTNANAAGARLKQNSTKEVFTWLNYDFTKTSFGAIGWFGSFGGAQSLGGTPNGTKTEYQQIRAEYAYRPTPSTQILGEVFHDINVVGGFKYNFGFTLRGALAF